MNDLHLQMIARRTRMALRMSAAHLRLRADVLRGVAGAAFLLGATLLLIGAAGMPIRSAAPLRGGAVAVVLVGDGETLSEIAARVDGGTPTRATVQAIRELNALTSSDLTAGATLRVPASHASGSALASR